MSEESNWRETLPEQLREAPYIKAAETPEQALQEIQNAAAWQGNSLRIPAPDATPEQIAEFQERAATKIPGLMRVPEGEALDEFYTKIGKPEAPEKYSIPDGDMRFSDEEAGQLKTWAHQNNMTQKQFEAFLGLNQSKVEEQRTALESKIAEEQAILTEEWGTSKDGRVQDIISYLRSEKTAPEGMLNAFEKGEYTAADARFLYTVVEAMRDGQEFHAQAEEPDSRLAPAEAKARLHELTGKLIGLSPTDPNYAVWQSERMEMARIVAESQAALDQAKLDKFRRPS